jgi:hypothetical protein
VDGKFVFMKNPPNLITATFFLAIFGFAFGGIELPLTLDDIGLMLRAGYSAQTIAEQLSTRHFAGTLDPATESRMRAASLSPVLIAALKDPKNTATQEEIVRLHEQQRARVIERERLIKEGAERVAAQERLRQQQPNQQSVLPLAQNDDWKFKLPSEIEADKKAAKAAEIAARKAYCETHPAECETQEAAQQARMKAEETQRELDSLKTTLWMEGLRP